MRCVLLLLASACLGGCEEPPNIPDDFPQLGTFQQARVIVLVDGAMLDASGDCRFDDEGVDMQRLRFHLRADSLWVDTQGRGPAAEYRVRDEQVVAWWDETTTYRAGPDCGDSLVRFEDERDYDVVSPDGVVTWGTLQLVLCDDEGESIEVSGKFSCSLW